MSRSQWSRRLAALAAGAVLCAACGPPQLTGLDPDHGPARSLVTVLGTNTEFSSIVWDPGTPDERTIPGSLGTRMFSVPSDVRPGPHHVALGRGSSQTTPIDFTVDAESLDLHQPRIDHVMALFSTFEPNSVNVLLYVQGANFDVGAVVEIDGVEVASLTHKAIRNDLHGVPPGTFKFPIFHYLSLLAVPGPKPLGTGVSIVVRNLDRTASEPLTYKLPASESTLDSDGDSLLDSWESAGYDGDGDGQIDTDVYRRDVFVELDRMDPLEFQLEPATLEAVRAMFAGAPFLNPLTDNGIHLVIDASDQKLPVGAVIFDKMGAAGNVPNNSTTFAFSGLKADHFDHKSLGSVYHYVIWARSRVGGGSGESDAPLGDALEPGDDILIGLDDPREFDESYQTTRSQAEILAHELGHDLGQRHGGWTDDGYNPNYWSVMTYAWVLRTGRSNVRRREQATCLPFYYAEANRIEVNHNLPATIGMAIGYSAGMAQRVVEDDYSLQEPTGVCNHPLDWNESGRMTETDLSWDANDNGNWSDAIEDFPNWHFLRLDGPVKHGLLP